MPKKKEPVVVVYMVNANGESKFFPSFSEAEVYAKDMCEENDEEVSILEVHKAWNVYYPVEPEPEASETSLIGLLDI